MFFPANLSRGSRYSKVKLNLWVFDLSFIFVRTEILFPVKCSFHNRVNYFGAKQRLILVIGLISLKH